MLQLLFTSACLIACVLCNSYKRPTYGPRNDGSVVNTGFGDEGRRVSGGGGRVESGFSDIVTDRRGGSVFGRVISGRRTGAAFDGLVSGRRGGIVFDGLVSGRKGARAVGNKGRGIGFGFEDFASGRGIGSGVVDRFSGTGIGSQGNDDFGTGRTELRWGQGSNDRRDDRWRETSGSQVRQNIAAKSYN